LNAFAKEQLEIDNDKLPIAILDTEQPENALVEAPCNSYDEQIDLLSSFALMNMNRGTSVILVRANKDVEFASESLRKNNIPHMKLSRKDMFKGISYKTLLSHFYVAINETNYKEWIQLLYRTKSLKTLSLSRRFIRKVKSLYLTPHDLMVYDKSSYVIEFDNSFRNNEIVIFDTETTGLNVYENDIIQIAAIKIRNGHLVPGSEFDIIIETDQTIPQYFSDGTLNPMLNEYQTRPHVDPQTAFSRFLEYIGDGSFYTVQFSR
jgi:DNA helicase-2/ATP-dependent DNA helicase PcrA